MLLLFVVQSCSYVWLVVTPRAVACQASVSFTGLLKFMSIESVMLSNHLTHCCPLLLLPSICLNISVFSNESAFHMRWPKYWNCSISSSDKYSGFPLGLMIWSPCSPRDSQEFSPSPQFKSINSLVFSLFYGPTLTFMQSTRKTIDLTGWTFIRKVISLLFNMLSRFVIAFLPKSKCL